MKASSFYRIAAVFYFFAAVLAWQLGNVPVQTLALMRVAAWAFALCFAVITVMSWRYLFVVPIAFSSVITMCLTVAAPRLSTPRLKEMISHLHLHADS
jgi:hypothetical protein